MTREDKLYSMRMIDLKAVADKLSIKINTKAAKSKAIEKILEAEAALDSVDYPTLEEIDENTISKESIEEIVGQDSLEQQELDKKLLTKNKSDKKKGKQLEFNGKSMNLNQWAKELSISSQTLFARLYISKWPIEKAFTQEIRKRKSNKED